MTEIWIRLGVLILLIHLICVFNIDILYSWEPDSTVQVQYRTLQLTLIITSPVCIQIEVKPVSALAYFGLNPPVKLSPRMDYRALGTIMSFFPRIATVYIKLWEPLFEAYYRMTGDWPDESPLSEDFNDQEPSESEDDEEFDESEENSDDEPQALPEHLRFLARPRSSSSRVIIPNSKYGPNN